MRIIADINELRKMKEPVEFAIACINGLYKHIGEQEREYENLLNQLKKVHAALEEGKINWHDFGRLAIVRRDCYEAIARAEARSA